jgi:hypothetical protein
MSRIFISGSSTGLGLMAGECSPAKVIRSSCTLATPPGPMTPGARCPRPKRS